MVKPTERFRIDKEKVVWRTVDGEAVVLNLDNGIYYTLNEMGSRIWERLAEGKNIEEISNTIAAQFETHPEKIRQDIIELIGQLKKAKLVEGPGSFKDPSS